MKNYVSPEIDIISLGEECDVVLASANSFDNVKEDPFEDEWRNF